MTIFTLTISSFPGCQEGVTAPGGVFDAGPLFAETTPMLVHEFLVKNTTGKAVHILGETHSCSCTNATFEPKELAPGESAPLEVKVHVPAGYSEQKLNVTIKTDHPVFPTWSYNILFVSYPKARIFPERIDLGRFILQKNGDIGGVEDSSSDRKEIWFDTFATATSKEHSPSSPISAIHSDDLNVTVDQKPQLDTMIGGIVRTRYKLTIGLAKETRTRGSHVSEIQLQNNSSEQPLAAATVTWTLDGLLRSAPQQIHFGMVDRTSAPVEKEFLVTLDQTGPFDFTKVESGSKYVTVHPGILDSSQDRKQSRRNVTMTLRPSKEMTQAVVSGFARLWTDALPKQEVVIPWSYFLKDP